MTLPATSTTRAGAADRSADQRRAAGRLRAEAVDEVLGGFRAEGFGERGRDRRTAPPGTASPSRADCAIARRAWFLAVLAGPCLLSVRATAGAELKPSTSHQNRPSRPAAPRRRADVAARVAPAKSCSSTSGRPGASRASPSMPSLHRLRNQLGVESFEVQAQLPEGTGPHQRIRAGDQSYLPDRARHRRRGRAGLGRTRVSVHVCPRSRRADSLCARG